jgi:hypothetical protein
MTLQDFFISGLPTGGNEARSRAAAMNTEQQLSVKSDQSDHEKNQRLSRPSIAIHKSPLPSSKRN